MAEKKILVISDTHGSFREMEEVLEKEAPFDILVHCGDEEGSLYTIRERDRPFDLYAVRGNCDGAGDPDHCLFHVGFYDILVVHGHRHGVKYSLDELLSYGKSQYADVILFGHSHVPEIVREKGVLLVNPGSLAYPHQSPRKKSYAVLTITDDELPRAVIRFFDDLPRGKERLPMDRIVSQEMRLLAQGRSVEEAARRLDIPYYLAERICRMIMTHPGIDVDGVLERLS